MGLLNQLIQKTYKARILFSKKTGMGISILKNQNNTVAKEDFYKLKATLNSGEQICFEKFCGKKILIVNLASQCGYTPQYEELEKLFQQEKAHLLILGFPSNDFGAQEPGTDEQIAEFCKINFGVTFPLFKKDVVSGKQKQPVYQWLSDVNKNGWNATEPAWNFTKYLIDENGMLTHVFSSSVSPLSDEILNETRK